MKRLPKIQVKPEKRTWHSNIPWNWKKLQSNISKLTMHGQVEIQRRV